MTAAPGPDLRDIHLPPPPDWWPPAPGWWVLAGVCILCAVIALYKMWRGYRRRRRNALAIAELNRCIAVAGADSGALAAALSMFLRRMALRDSPAAAAFADERWLDYLDARIGGEQFRRGVGRVLLHAPFRPAHAYDAAGLVALVRRWTRTVLAAERAHD